MRRTVLRPRTTLWQRGIVMLGIAALTAFGVALTFAAVEEKGAESSAPPRAPETPPAAEAPVQTPAPAPTQAAEPDAAVPMVPAEQKKVFDDLADLYIYAFPAVLMDQMQREMTDSVFFAPVNKMAYRTILPSPALRMSECPNVDSLLSTAWFDLADGPQIVLLPEAPRQKYLLELTDAWTNVVGDVNSKNTADWPVYEVDGRRVKAFAVVGPKTDKVLPEGMKSFVSPTDRLWLINRVLLGDDCCERHSDLAAVCRTLYEFEIVPLTEFEKLAKPSQPAAVPETNSDAGAVNRTLRLTDLVFVAAKTTEPIRERFVAADETAPKTDEKKIADKKKCDDDKTADKDDDADDCDDDADACNAEAKDKAKKNGGDAKDKADNDDNADDDPEDADDGANDNDDDADDAIESEATVAELTLVVPETAEQAPANAPSQPAAEPMTEPAAEQAAQNAQTSAPSAEKAKNEPPQVEKPNALPSAEKPSESEKPAAKKPSAPKGTEARYEIRRSPFRRYGVVIQKAAYQPNRADDNVETQTKPAAAPSEVKPTEVTKSEANPETKPEAVPSEAKPAEVIKSEAKPEVKPEAAPSEAKPAEVTKPETKPEAVSAETKPEAKPAADMTKPEAKPKGKIREEVKREMKKEEERFERYGRDADEAMDRMEREIAEFFSRSFARSRAMARDAMESGADAAEYFDRRAKRNFHRMAQDFAPLFGGEEWKLHPVHRVLRMSSGEFFGRFAELMKTNPPAEMDPAIQAKMKAVGMVPGESFDLSAASAMVRHLARFAVPYAQAKMHEGAIAGVDEKRGPENWVEPKDLGDFGTNYLCRAIVAEKFLGANRAKAVLYPFTFHDAAGNPLDGRKSYRIHFAADALPPVEFLWSISLYDAAFQLTPNRIKRYSLRSNQPLVYNTDGSLDLVISNAEPAENLSNWLPAPKGEFMLMTRLYLPKAAALDGTWSLPGVVETK